MNNITFVTAYYNLREKENNPYRFKDEGFCTHDWYLNSFKKLLVKDVNLIIFTENIREILTQNFILTESILWSVC